VDIVIRPELERVELSPEDAAAALELLIRTGILGDAEIVHSSTLRMHARCLRRGYYLRLVWPRGCTLDDYYEWCRQVRELKINPWRVSRGHEISHGHAT